MHGLSRAVLGQIPASLTTTSFPAADTTTDAHLPVDLAGSLADAHDHPVLLLPTALWVAHMLWFLPWDPGSLAAFRPVARQLAELRAASTLKPAGRCDVAARRPFLSSHRASPALLLCSYLMSRVMQDYMSLWTCCHCGASNVAGWASARWASAVDDQHAAIKKLRGQHRALLIRHNPTHGLV